MNLNLEQRTKSRETNLKFKMTAKNRIRERVFLFLAVLVLITTVGCKDKTTEDECKSEVNNKNYQLVADDTDCSNYWRGSAELGLAGFNFSKFVSAGAQGGFPKALGLTTEGCNIEPGVLELDQPRTYFSAYHEHYLMAQYWTRWIYDGTTTERPLDDTEISLFAAAGEVVSEIYCNVDSQLDGKITVEEISNFTTIQKPTSKLGVSKTNYVFVVKDNTPWVIDTTDSKNFQCRKSPDYSSVWSRLLDPIPAMDNAKCIGLFAGASEISLVVQINSMPRLFVEGSTKADIKKPFDLLEGALQKGGDIVTDLSTLGIGEDSEILQTIKEQMASIDNGGECSNEEGGLALIQSLAGILDNLEHAEAYDASDFDLTAKNKFGKDDVTALDSTISLTCPSGVTDCGVRTIFDSGTISDGTVTDLYYLANSDISETFSLISYLSVDPNSPTESKRVSKAGDFNITLEELLCLQ